MKDVKEDYQKEMFNNIKTTNYKLIQIKTTNYN